MKNNELMRLYILLEELKEELNILQNVSLQDFIKSMKNEELRCDNLLKKIFPNLTLDEQVSLLTLLKMLTDEQKNNDVVEIVATLPAEVKFNCRKTISVLRQILLEAESSILLTGYVASEYFNEINDIIIEKSKSNVEVNFYVDNNKQMNAFIGANLLNISNSSIRIFRYKKREKFSSLHAKVVLVDNKNAFVSSSNLSYNGIMNNIEVGTLIRGKKAKEIANLFNSLRLRDYFEEIKK